MSKIITEVDGLNELLGEFKNFASQRAPIKEPINLSSFLNDLSEALQWDGLSTHFNFSAVPDNLNICADRGQMKQVFMNLFNNAIFAMNNEGMILVRVDLITKGFNRFHRIQIIDSGPGIDEKAIGEVFKPYYTSSESGTGLGLSIVERIIFDHDGRIWLQSPPQGGCSFYIDLPYKEEYGKDFNN